MIEKRSYFDGLAPRWDEMPRPADAAGRIAAFCRRSATGARRILDVGSGTGLLAPFLLSGAEGPSLLVELDFAMAMLRASRAKTVPEHRTNRLASDRRAPSIQVFVCADALHLPFAEGTFDAVLCFGILPHLGEAHAALSALWRMAAPGGRLAIGHLMGSRELNARHREIGGPVGEDTLPPADEAASLLSALGASRTEAEDKPDGYFVLGERGAR